MFFLVFLLREEVGLLKGSLRGGLEGQSQGEVVREDPEERS